MGEICEEILKNLRTNFSVNLEIFSKSVNAKKKYSKIMSKYFQKISGKSCKRGEKFWKIFRKF